MLQFFRRHQKIFFIFTSVIIISSFTFFGTYQSFLPSHKEKDETLYKVESSGRKVSRQYLQQMNRFLSLEGPSVSRKELGNFLNEGIISQYFLDSDLGLTLAEGDEEIEAVLVKQFQKEKGFTPYAHPSQPMLSAKKVWEVFAPQIGASLETLQTSEDPLSQESFKARSQLFRAQVQFPPGMLAQVLRYQFKDHPNVIPDNRFLREDFALFGYRNLNDWFGEPLVNKACRVIIEGAELARSKGIKVSREEVRVNLLQKSQKAYTLLQENTQVPLANGQELLNVFLHQIGVEESALFSIWEDVLLFTRLLDDTAQSVLVDTLPFENFYQAAHAHATLSLTQLPKPFHLTSMDDLKAFETYLEAVSGAKKDPLHIPSEMLPIEQVKVRAPELVGRLFSLYVAHVPFQAVTGKVSLKKTWEWESENLTALQDVFPELKQKELDDLSSKKRLEIDAYAREMIAREHPEWIEESVKNASMDEKECFLSNSTTIELEGISDPKALIALLDVQDELSFYTQNQKDYYRILVRQRGEEEILSFEKAREMNRLETLLVSESAFQALLKTVQEKYKVSEQEAPAYRFVSFMEKFKRSPLEGSLVDQLKPQTKPETISRMEKGVVAFDELVEDAPVQVDVERGTPFYYELVDQSVETSFPQKSVIQAQEMLSKESKTHLTRTLIGSLSA